MSEHQATITWERNNPDFLRGKYSREHTWTFAGGATVAASPSPSVVPAPWSNPAYVDPEEAYVASISSCHLLTLLFLAARAGFVIDHYRDDAVGIMRKNENDVPWISEVTLQPRIASSGDKLPTPEDEKRLHHAAHEQCFIANSIKTHVTVEGASTEMGPCSGPSPTNPTSSRASESGSKAGIAGPVSHRAFGRRRQGIRISHRG